MAVFSLFANLAESSDVHHVVLRQNLPNSAPARRKGTKLRQKTKRAIEGEKDIIQQFLFNCTHPSRKDVNIQQKTNRLIYI
jgi:hypothetical protein